MEHPFNFRGWGHGFLGKEILLANLIDFFFSDMGRKKYSESTLCLINNCQKTIDRSTVRLPPCACH